MVDQKLQQALIKELGFNVGMRFAGIVLPSILKDFEKKLEKSLVGATVSEIYYFDDMDGEIEIFGTKLPDGSFDISKVLYNGKDLLR